MSPPDPAAIAAFQFSGQDIPWLLRQWASTRPDHPFLCWEPKPGDGPGAQPRVWTYAQFADDVAKLAAGLHQRGVRKGDKVMIHAENCPEAVISWYACATLGAVGVTTNTRSVGAEIQYFSEHTGCVAAITQPQFARLIRENAKGVQWVAVTDHNSGETPSREQATDASSLEPFAALFGDAASVPKRPAEPMLPAGIMFTSGTTSRPKAVVHTHANALWAARVGPRNIDMRGEDTYLIYLPFFHVNAQSWSTWTTLGVGGTIVLQPKFSASRFWEVILKHDVTHISLIPFVFKAVASQPIPEHKLKVGVFGLIMPDLENWLKLRVAACYGMTETVIHATTTDPFQPYLQGSMGKPTPGYEFAIVDTDTSAFCANGEVGELWVRGTRGIQLFYEYYDNPEAMEKAFTPDGWFKTGDRVRMGDDGNFFYTDRDKDALKVGGENVSAREVEDAVRQVEGGGIADVAVVAQSHEMLDVVPVAFVVKAPGAPDDAEFEKKIIEHCASRLADFKVPRAVYFVDAFPTATLDKVAKNKLREQADARANQG